MNKLSFSNANPYLKENKSKTRNKSFSKPNINKRPTQTFQTYKLNSNLQSEKALNKMLKTYKDFVNRNFKNYQFSFDNIINVKNEEEEIKQQNHDLKTKIKSNIDAKVKESKSVFQNFLGGITSDFLDENIICEIPDIPRIYGEESTLGKNKNNSKDYLRRRAELIKDNILLLSEELEPNLPLSEINLELDNDNNINYGQDLKELNTDENDGGSPSIVNDKYLIIQRRSAVNTIIEICKVRLNKVILYIGLDPINKIDILRIFGKIFDENGKIKIIEFNKYSIKYTETFTLEKKVKDIFNIDSMSREEIIQRIDEVIKKFLES